MQLKMRPTRCIVRNRTQPEFKRLIVWHKHKKMSKIFLRVHVHSTMEEEEMSNRWITDYKVQQEKTSDTLCRYDFSVSIRDDRSKLQVQTNRTPKATSFRYQEKSS